MATNLQAVTRELSTRSYIKGLRQKGWVPGVVYGRELDGVSIQVSRGDLQAFIRREGRHSLLNLTIDQNEKVNAMIQELQVDPLDQQVLHVDFQQITKGEKINTVLPIQLIGTPAGVKEGGILQQVLTEVAIRVLPEEIPASLEVSVDHLAIGDQIRVGDLSLPEGVELQTDEDEMIASVLPPKLDPVEEEETPDHPEMVETTGGEN